MITNINEFKKYLESKYDLYSTTINHNEIKEGDKVYTILGPFAGKDKYYGIVNDIKPNELFITFYEVGTDKQVSNNTQMVYDYIHKLNGGNTAAETILAFVLAPFRQNLYQDKKQNRDLIQIKIKIQD